MSGWPRRPGTQHEGRVPHIALILVVLGLFPDLESALYVTAVVSFLFMDGLILLYLVHSQGRPPTA